MKLSSSTATAALLLASCTVHLDLPTGVDVQCVTDTECPEGYRCNSSTSACVAENQSDLQAPAVVAASVVATADEPLGPFVVTVEMSEPLGLAPDIALIDADGVLSLEVDPAAAADGVTYTARFTASGDESEGAHPLTIVAEDVVGNQTSGPLGASISLDFTAPDVVAALLQLIPDDDDASQDGFERNPRSDVTAVTYGTTGELRLVLNEVAVTPAITITENGSPVIDSGLSFVRQPPDGATELFSLEQASAGSLRDGIYGLRTDLRDAVGNLRADVDLGVSIEVDTTAPEPPAVADAPGAPALVTYNRAPWGAVGSPDPAFSLEGEVGATAPGALIIIYADRAATTELARLVATDEGEFFAPLPIGDLSELYAVAVDGAGNRSDDDPSTAAIDASLVERVRWSATLLGKLPGSNFGNPNSFEERPAFQLEAEPLVVPSPLVSGLNLALGSPETTASAGTWRKPQGVTQLGWASSGVAFHGARGLVLRFGGHNWVGESTAEPTGVRVLDGLGWYELPDSDPDADGAPRPRGVPQIVYDGARAQLVLAPSGTTTWVHDGFTWRAVLQPSLLEAPGSGGVLIAHQHERTVILARADGTWIFDGVLWTRADQSGCSEALPSPMGALEGVYQVARREALLLDGQSMWVWRDGCWESAGCAVSPCTQQPASRSGFALAYDTDREVVILHGGFADIAGEAFGFVDTWEWDGEDWRCDQTVSGCDPSLYACAEIAGVEQDYLSLCNQTRAHPAYLATVPPDPGNDPMPLPDLPHVAGGGSMVYDPDAQRTLLFGDASTFDTAPRDLDARQWHWDGSAWTELPRQQEYPLPKGTPLMARHPPSNSVMAFGSRDDSSVHDQTWVYDGQRWQLRCTGGCLRPTVTAGTEASLAYDEGTGRVVYFGGDGTPTTWEWDPLRPGSASEWEQVCPAAGCSLQPPWNSVGGAYSPDHSGVVWIGPRDAADGDRNSVWVWSAGQWSRLCEGGTCGDPAPQLFAISPVVWDPIAPGIVVADLSSTWVLTAGAWVQRESPGSGALVTDGSREAVVAIHSYSPIALLPATGPWASQQLLGPRPLSTTDVGVAFHAGLERLIVFGGGYSMVIEDMVFPMTSGETWELDVGAKRAPAHIFGAAFEAARAPATDLRAIEVQWRGTAHGYDAGGSVEGARLMIWHYDHWRATNAVATPDAGGWELVWRSDADPAWAEHTSADLRRLLVGFGRVVHAAVLPSEPNGPGAGIAEITTEEMQVSVVYDGG